MVGVHEVHIYPRASDEKLSPSCFPPKTRTFTHCHLQRAGSSRGVTGPHVYSSFLLDEYFSTFHTAWRHRQEEDTCANLPGYIYLRSASLRTPYSPTSKAHYQEALLYV